MVVKPFSYILGNIFGLRVVLSHMVVKPKLTTDDCYTRLRVVLSHMVVKRAPSDISN